MQRNHARRYRRGSAAGNFVALVLFLGLIALGAWLWLGSRADERGAPTGSASESTPQAAEPAGDAPAPIEPVDGTPVLEAAAPYTPQGGVLQIDISEYAGYGGLIVANGGLAPNPESFFAKQYGFQV